MSTKYDHLLPPELPRNAPKRVATDLDCYPAFTEQIGNLREVPMTVVDVVFTAAWLPMEVLFAVSRVGQVLFNKDGSHVE